MFGDYQLLFRMENGMWLGRQTDGEAEVCVKMISVPEAGERDTAPAERMLISAALQQEIARHSSRWAPVLRLGSDGVDSFCITRKYPRSLQTLLDQSVAIRPDQLQPLLLDIVEGLIDLMHTYGVPHGNLKPGNVFLTSSDRIDEGEVRLSDPDADAESKPADIFALGRILYSLVTLRNPDALESQLVFDAPWRRLGLSGKKWFDLCSHMLAFDSTQNLSDLSDLRQRIASIRVPKGGRSFVTALFF